MDPIRNRIKGMLNSLEQMYDSHREPVEGIQRKQGDYDFGETFVKEGIWEAFGRDETWGGRDRHYWFYVCIPSKKEWQGKEVRVILNTGADDIWNTDNPQVMVYVNGRLAGTMDMNHQAVILTECGREGELFELAFYAYSNSPSETNFFHLDTAVYEKEIAELYYDLKVPFEGAELLPEGDLERIETFKILNHCVGLLDWRKPDSTEFKESVKKADEYIKERFYKEKKKTSVTVHSIGHTHIDVAWKWPLKQTRQKTVRSFRTVLNLMERYPEYKFMSSQAQLYEFVKEEAPGLYEQIKEKIAEGRWEAEGGAWLEPDCNLSSGESLIRHILYGRHFFEKELGAPANEVFWLPDVFGYSAALPQIMKKSGLSYFMTTKLGWNEYNKFPYDTFKWRGIDGSEVLTYLITTRDYIRQYDLARPTSNSTTYNGLQNADHIMGTWQRYQNKDVSHDVLTCYGYGDGGGGPTEEMLEQSRRLEYGVVKCPQVHQTFVKDFFHILEKNMDTKRLPVWSGELYLEFHRGTYTSMAKNKWYNRRCEFLNGDAEFYSVLAMLNGRNWEYPQKELEKNWKLLLLNQFHDILPGSAIEEVYKDSEEQYQEILASDREIIKKAQSHILGEEKGAKAGLAVWNGLSFERTGLVEMDMNASGLELPSQETEDGKILYLVSNVPSKGYRTYENEMAAEGNVLEEVITDEKDCPLKIRTPFYEVEFNGQGEFVSLYDRREKRELLKKGTCGNRLLVYEDRPLEFDAWNIDSTYQEHVWNLDDVTEFKVTENGALRGTLSIRRIFMDSVLEQKICFYKHTARIDFKTTVDWNEHQLLLKTEFPLDIRCEEAAYEIQFGNVKRATHKNTTWNQAMFEVCAHKWADISEYGYGAALLNDCKYGYSINDSVMALTLIKSGIFPNPNADQGRHEFTYAFYPHKGDFRCGNVIQEAYDLNCPLQGQICQGEGKEEQSFLQIEEPNIIVDTVKKSENGEDIIVRFYEAYGMRTTVHAKFPLFEGFTVSECDCMEEVNSLNLEEDYLKEQKWNKNALEFQMKPYEIKTLRLSKYTISKKR